MPGLLAFLLPLAMACQGESGAAPAIPEPAVPEFVAPADHAPAPELRPNSARQRATPIPSRLDLSAEARARAAQAREAERLAHDRDLTTTRRVAPSAHAPAPAASPGAEQPGLGDQDPVALPTTPEQEGARWLMASNLVEPGCLMSGERPELHLPSPLALAWIIKQSPHEFSGISREALVCLLGLPRLTGSEVYGATVFRGLALAGSAAVDGGERQQGVLAVAVVTEVPAGEGTLLLIMDERAGSWDVRAAVYTPWLGDAGTRRFVTLRPERLMHPRRRGVVLTQKDRHRTVEHHYALTEAQRLLEVLSLMTQHAPGDGTKVRARVAVTGRSWPRRVTWRARGQASGEAGDESDSFALEEWTAERGAAYVRQTRLDGEISVGGARELVTAGHAASADWVLSKLPKRQRSAAQVHELRAEIASRNRHYKTAQKHWRRALKARDVEPGARLRFAEYLAGRKQKKAARRELKRYLKDNPSAPDRTAVEARLDELTR